MPDPHWTEYGRFYVALVGFAFLIVQLVFVLQALRSNAQTKLYDQYLKVNEMLLQRPYLRPYFYASPGASKELPAAADSESQRTRQLEVDALAEMIAGLVEHAELQSENLPDKTCWRAYTRARYKDSPALQQFLSNHHDWYAEEFHDLLKELEVTLPKPNWD